MRDYLAERVLARVLQWNAKTAASERPLLQAMAAMKYDEYQQFAPGLRFIESLSNWLMQFDTGEEREVAYAFFKSRLAFISDTEMKHLIEVSYPDHLAPLFLKAYGGDDDPTAVRLCDYDSKGYSTYLRKCLFLGMSDGAQIDYFRRVTPKLSHEQVEPFYQVNDERLEGALKELQKQLDDPNALFTTLVMVEDFAASGHTSLRLEKDGSFGGKIAKILRSLKEHQYYGLFDLSTVNLVLLFYVATDQALARLNDLLPKAIQHYFPESRIRYRIVVPQVITSEERVTPGRDVAFCDLLEKYYDPSIETPSMKEGGDRAVYGFADCALPVVLSHNTPNNSVHLLWADTNSRQGLFPRVERHKKA